MKMSQKPWVTALIFIGVGVTAVVGGIILYRIVRRPDIFAHITQADRVYIHWWGEPDLNLTYTGVELSRIIDAIQNGQRDRGSYNTPSSNFVMDFFQGEVKIARIRTGSDLFTADGKQYRTFDGALTRLVDDPLYAAYRKKHKQ